MTSGLCPRPPLEPGFFFRMGFGSVGLRTMFYSVQRGPLTGQV